jgi:cyclophilin family peptidyl-prolyl cis-trans isomerase
MRALFVLGGFLLHGSQAFVPSTRQIPSFHPVSAPQEALMPIELKASRHKEADEETLLRRRSFIAQSTIAASLLSLSQLTTADDSIDPSINLPKITSKVFLDIKLPTIKEPKRLTIGLFGDDMPKASSNFQALCTNSEGPSYVGTNFYRVISDTSIQAGAIGKDVNSGKSGTSSFDNGAPFEPDNYNILHTKRGLVSGVRNKDGSMDSRFFIQTESDAGWADGRYAAFGIVLDDELGGNKNGVGMELVKKISKVEVKAPQNSPKETIEIVGCGLL